jgi:4'-phosphopantetheinyl transferase EntD
MPFGATSDTMAVAGYTHVVATCDARPAYPLTPREQCEYEALAHAARRRDWLAGRYAAKRAISIRRNVAPDAIELAAAPGTAPRAFVRTRADSWAPLPDRLTIAHRDGIAIAAAFPSGASVGVDIERSGEVSAGELGYIASEPERARLRGIDPTLIWILKEAAWKALGLPSATPLSALQLVFRRGADELVAVRQGSREHKARADIKRLDTDFPLIAALVEIASEVS